MGSISNDQVPRRPGPERRTPGAVDSIGPRQAMNHRALTLRIRRARRGCQQPLPGKGTHWDSTLLCMSAFAVNHLKAESSGVQLTRRLTGPVCRVMI